MSRLPAPQRFADIVATATRLFIEHGYRRTRMLDVARELGITEPALYRYFEGKGALFDEVVRSTVGEGSGPDPELPISNPAPESTIGFLRHVVSRESRIASLEAALKASSSPPDAVGELREILQELLDNIERNRIGLKVLERAAPDWPELAALWFGHGRAQVHANLASYLERRGTECRLRPLPHPRLSARLILEAIAYAGMHRHTDPFPTSGDPDAVANATIDDLVHAYRP